MCGALPVTRGDWQGRIADFLDVTLALRMGKAGEVRGATAADNSTVIVNADTGDVVTSWGTVREVAPNRVVCDANRKIVDLDAAEVEDLHCGATTQPFKTTRAEGQSATA
jgi:hypothetical protein